MKHLTSFVIPVVLLGTLYCAAVTPRISLAGVIDDEYDRQKYANPRYHADWQTQQEIEWLELQRNYDILKRDGSMAALIQANKNSRQFELNRIASLRERMREFRNEYEQVRHLDSQHIEATITEGTLSLFASQINDWQRLVANLDNEIANLERQQFQQHRRNYERESNDELNQFTVQYEGQAGTENALPNGWTYSQQRWHRGQGMGPGGGLSTGPGGGLSMGPCGGLSMGPACR